MIQGFVIGVVVMYAVSWLLLKACKKRGLPLLRPYIVRLLKQYADDLVNEPGVIIEESPIEHPHRRVLNDDGLARIYANLIIEELDRNG